jgi:2-desacetyl-2-hydroxyethyl bacteriochlorophyllide A dehydrogenase
MRSIVCEEPNRLVMKRVEVPIPAPGEALIRVRRIGVCGTDLHAYKGLQPFFAYPRILGHELAGEIVRIGNHEGLAAGDIVSVIPYVHCGKCIACRSGKMNCCKHMSVIGVHQDGGMREYMTVPSSNLIRADGLTLDQAAIVECLSISAHAVRLAEIKTGDFVLVIGAGPIGMGLMKFAKLAGARVIAMDMNEQRLSFCSHWVPVDYTVHVKGDPLQKVQAITGGDFPTIVMDATGNARSMESALHYVAHGGRLIYVGLVNRDLSFNDPEFHKREMAIMGSRNATKEDFEYVMDCIRNRVIDTGSFITHRTDFDHMIFEYEAWLKPETGVIKAIVELNERKGT